MAAARAVVEASLRKCRRFIEYIFPIFITRGRCPVHFAAMEPGLPVAFVSDETYSAICDVAIEFARNGKSVAITRPPRRAGRCMPIFLPANIRSRSRRMGLARSASSRRSIPRNRINSDCSPIRCTATPGRNGTARGAGSEFRVHCPDESYHLSLWRYGKEKELIRPIGWFDEHGPRANQQILPDGDFTPPAWTGIGRGTTRPRFASRRRSARGCTTFTRRRPPAGFCHFRGSLRPLSRKRRWPSSLRRTRGMPTTTSAGEAITSSDRVAI